ncbi:hypothetical protein ACP3P6_18075 [Enterobacter mori]
MWGYQDSYRIHIQILARNVLKKLGAPAGCRSAACWRSPPQ